MGGAWEQMVVMYLGLVLDGEGASPIDPIQPLEIFVLCTNHHTKLSRFAFLPNA